MLLCFIGGGNYASHELERLDHRFMELVELKSMLIFPFATDPSKREGWYNTISSNYAKYGIEQFTMIDEEMDTAELKSRIHASNSIYFTGGRPERLITTLHEKHIMRTIQEYNGAIMGYSAGALALCAECVITKDRDYPETIVMDGIGFVDFSVEVHYELDDMSRDNELIRLSECRTILAIPNGSGLLVGNERLEYINPIYTFHQGRKQRLN
ncbi:Type 1 glutamine amidotransferase-like domain-containing protein [Paenibacillus alvei]|uniref:Peptidase E n=1 Tax=Paenibacillus alvei TaxID=44250 RepID=A0A383R7E7_PAEAL|nr:Type 1 glutamine amidotransferase-like domain-containing protein [Paenibacillus alvei]SYX83015.1 conserved protein of unknown function [Paenibacillus alvei]